MDTVREPDTTAVKRALEPWRLEAPDAAAPANAERVRWYVVQTIRGREKFAKDNLERQKVPTFLPLLPRQSQMRRACADRVDAFFPGYLFVSLPRTSSLWRSVGGTYGVSRIVRFGDEPIPVPVGLVEQLIALTGTDGVLGFADELRVGERVKIIGGAFDRWYGELCSAGPLERVVVLLDVMGREVPVKLARRSLMRAAEEEPDAAFAT